MGKVQVDHEQLRVLKERAVSIGTLEKWADLALEWAEAANSDMVRMQQALKQIAELPVDAGARMIAEAALRGE